MQRPFIQHSIDELELEYEKAVNSSDAHALDLIAHELLFRKTPRAHDLAQALAGLVPRQRAERATPPTRPPAGPLGVGRPTVRPAPPARPERVRARTRFAHQPTPEQAQAIAEFLKGGSLKINAYAGTGKTSTLELLAHATTTRGHYLAFNRNIVNDARARFPTTVHCSTSHGLAYFATPAPYKQNGEKMTGKLNAHGVAEILDLRENWRIAKDRSLKPASQGSLILKTIQRFTQSADPEPDPKHVPLLGSLVTASKATIRAVEAFAVRGAKQLWDRMQNARDPVPLGHDGYLKLWSLSRPIIAADFILLDEAQDTNPVVLDVLRRQPAQMVYVGDKCQQIYEWRGAMNAMGEIATDATTLLTRSFRFGDAIAQAASTILARLGESVPIQGNPDIHSRLGPTDAETILARTNAVTITAIIEALDEGLNPHLVGGNGELLEMLRGVQDLKRGQPSTVSDFFGFNNWGEVVEFAKGEDGGHLLAFVNLVESRGEKQLMWALNRTVTEDNCDVIVSTAHKAKGREWSKVRLMDDFLKSRPRPANEKDTEEPGKPIQHDPAELRLFYVALTRAREELELAPPLMSLLGLESPGGSPPAPSPPPSRLP